jgi:hypothetical protein
MTKFNGLIIFQDPLKKNPGELLVKIMYTGAIIKFYTEHLTILETKV